MERRLQLIIATVFCAVLVFTATLGLVATSAFAGESTSPSLVLNGATAKRGETVELEVQIRNNPGIIGATLEVDYDSALILTSISNGSAFSALEMTRPGELTSGCRIHWDAMDVTDENVKDGAVLLLRFVVSNGAAVGSAYHVSVAPVTENGHPDVFNRDLETVNLQAATCDVSVAIVPVTSISLDRNSLEFTKVGAQETLEATVLPESATDKSVVWSTSDEDVASVNQNGVVTAAGDGYATVTATTSSGGLTAKCAVHVDVPESAVSVTGVSLDWTELTLTSLGQQAQLCARVMPEGATNRAVRWNSSNRAVATVSDAGLVAPVANGTTLVTATTVDGGYVATCAVKVDIPVPKTPIDEATVKVVATTYTGYALEPSVTVNMGGVVLVRGTDYTLSFAKNVNAGTAIATVTGMGNYTGSKSTSFTIAKASSSISLTAQTKTYTGQSLAYTGKVKRSGSASKVTYRYYIDADCTKEVKAANVKKAGTYYVCATLATDANYKAATSAATKFTIKKATNPLGIKVSKKTTNYAKTKKSTQTVTPITVSKSQGKKTFKVTKWVTAKAKSYFVVNKTSGKVTVRKGIPKGTYKFKVKITAAGNANYEAGTKTVTVSIIVK